MRVRTALGWTAAAVLVGGAGTAAADEAITVFPPKAAPGSTVFVRVSCPYSAEWVEYSSPAFAAPTRVDLAGETAAEQEFVLSDDLEPGDYQVRGECGAADSSHVQYASVTVPAPDGSAVPAPQHTTPSPAPTPSGAPNAGGGGLARPASTTTPPFDVLAAGLLLLGATAVVALRQGVRRGRPAAK